MTTALSPLGSKLADLIDGGAVTPHSGNGMEFPTARRVLPVYNSNHTSTDIKKYLVEVDDAKLAQRTRGN
ncbi:MULTISPECIES: hypothetical protein [Pacificimonas]|uniref:Uncharacterized protein n=1 Tax=Pacificimonas aurantium TaxID=1250540 RepID=A0ABS7WIC3_9SPHN|nr:MULTISPECIES: hypothetical protein [Pacificimonas]MBZ6377373.1 hypothetical protein [Pacificimonas aurantium]